MSTKTRTRVAGKSLRKAGVGGAALSIAAVTAIAGAGVANANATFTFNRIFGADRYETTALTAAAFGNSTNAILASGEVGHSVDALSAAYLAGVKQAPVLLTRNESTPPGVLAQLAANKVMNIFVVGGNGVVSDAQVTALTEAGFNVTRVGGLDRYDTSAAVIAAADKPTGDTALLASGTVFADALGAGPLSYAKDIPLAITDPNTLSPQTLTALSATGVKNIDIVGGTAAVSPAVAAQLTAAKFTVNRIAGIDRSETSAKLAAIEVAVGGFSATAVNVASGDTARDGADALGGAALSGKELRPLLITNNANDAGSLPAYLSANSSRLATGTIFGGFGAVSQPVEDQLTAAAKTPTANPGNSGTTVNGPNSATQVPTLPSGTSLEAGGLAIPITPADTVSFRYTLKDGAMCAPGAPRAFVTVTGGTNPGTFNSFNANTPGTNVTAESQCGTLVTGTTDTFDVSFSLTNGGTVTAAGLVFDRPGETGSVDVSNFFIAGQQILFA